LQETVTPCSQKGCFFCGGDSGFELSLQVELGNSYQQSLYGNVYEPSCASRFYRHHVTFLQHCELQQGSTDAWRRGTSCWSPLAQVPVRIKVTSIDLSCIQNNHLGVKKSTAWSLFPGLLSPHPVYFKNMLNELSFWLGLTWRFKDGGNNETTKSRQKKRSEGLSAAFSPPPSWSSVVLSPAVSSNSWPSYHPYRVISAAVSWGDLATRQLSWSLSHKWAQSGKPRGLDGRNCICGGFI